MKLIALMNTSMMPVPGTYKLEPLSLDEFRTEIIKAYTSGEMESFIGYREVVDIISEIASIRPQISRRDTYLSDGDTMLICKLKYRVRNPMSKGHLKNTIDDYEFFKCVFERGEE